MHFLNERDVSDAEQVVFGGTDSICAAPSGKQDGSGADLPEGVARVTFCRWQKQFVGMRVAVIRRLQQLEDENGKPKRPVADLTLDRGILQDALWKSGEALCAP